MKFLVLCWHIQYLLQFLLHLALKHYLQLQMLSLHKMRLSLLHDLACSLEGMPHWLEQMLSWLYL